MIIEIWRAVFDGFFSVHPYPTAHSSLLCPANVVLLQLKRATVGRQKDYSLSAKVVLLQ